MDGLVVPVLIQSCILTVLTLSVVDVQNFTRDMRILGVVFNPDTASLR
jgi:hypothetical protein